MDTRLWQNEYKKTIQSIICRWYDQSVWKLKIDKSILSRGTYIFYFITMLKTAKRGNHQHPHVFKTYPQNSNLCIIDFLKEYRSRTNLVRKILDGNLWKCILSYAYPFKVHSKIYEAFSWNGRVRHYNIYDTFRSQCINYIRLSIKDIGAAGWKGTAHVESTANCQ